MRKITIFSRFVAMMLCVAALLAVVPVVAASGESATINLNDGVYTYGRFDKDGNPYDKDKPIESGFRSANYLPVEGGRDITCYYAAAEWNGENIGRPLYVVEYDLGKNIIAGRSKLMSYYPGGKMGLTLNERTAYIRLYYMSNDAIATPLDSIEIAVYYVEDYENCFIPYVAYNKVTEDMYYIDPLYGKRIIYDGDSIAESRLNTAYNGGGYAQLIASATHGTYINYAEGGALLSSSKTEHSVVDNLNNLPADGDLYCFQGGINDYFANVELGHLTASYSEPVDTKTVIGAMEHIFRYCQTNFPGKPVCFVITHKVRTTAIKPNANGDTFQDYHDAMVAVCNKYSIPYYDAFLTSGLNGWESTLSNNFLTGNESGTGDGTHPNEEGYRRYYVPQMLSLFRTIMPE